MTRSHGEAPAGAARGFSGVKLELGIILVICVGVAIAVLRLDYPNWLELLVLGAVGFVCGGWLAIRTRKVVSRHGSDGSEGYGPRQE